MLYYTLFSFGLGILTLLFFGLLQWLHIPSGNIVDWLIGVASFWWLLTIVTVPWNVYFEAKAAIADAEQSLEKGIVVADKAVRYAQKVARWSLLLAIALHTLSAIGLYGLAIAGISQVGYVSSAATLLLTFLRPVFRAYQYLAARLTAIRREIKYPREDVIELRHRVQMISATLQQIEEKLDPHEPHSWVATITQENANLRQSLANLQAQIEQDRAQNNLDHQKIAREAKQSISQLTEDSQFLGHVREIIRFFKTA
ncbi:MAG: hypothetical protein SAJ12_19855 [Jaaginema sp. PMC 1079.18]|nr:hypothetical protein [Jaaginema sp. PMC 1080.18]MEC4853242.1 hypothetical protein [Jaaginema sp. PMC 1079.18]MEC4866518.1 hypothetical protein [Jaaginema sp. PMC 1078.18]